MGLGLGLGLAERAALGGGGAASLDIDFTSGALDPSITFTRASPATYFDSAGVLRTSGYNLLARSEEFDHATWVKTAASITANATAAPNGAATADQIVTTSTGTNCFAAQVVSGIVSSVPLTYSIYLKAGTAGFARIWMVENASPFTAGARADINLSTGAIVRETSAGTATGRAVTVTNAGNGWWRVAITVTLNGPNTSVSARVYVKNDSADNTIFSGTTGSALFVWGAQLETGTLSEYSATTSAANGGPRFDYDPVTLAARGLLIEESRTNSIRNSSMAGAVAGVPGSGGTAPTNWGLAGTAGGLTRQIMGTGTEDGIPYIDVRIFGTDGTYGDITFDTGTLAATSGQAWTGSVFLRLMAGSFTNLNSASLIVYGIPNFTDNGQLSIKGTTNSPLRTQRLSVSRTLADGTTTSVSPRLAFTPGTGAVDITLRIGCPQLEQGVFATSPMLTPGSATVTRAQDTPIITTLTPWFNATEGSAFAEFMIPNVSLSLAHMLLSIDDATSNERMSLRPNAGTLGLFVFDGGVAQTSPLTAGIAASGVVTKAAFRYGLNDFAVCKDGGAVSTDTSGTLPTVTRMTLGYRLVSSDILNGYLRKIRIFNYRLSNAALQGITS
jgi:hypothetical protein